MDFIEVCGTLFNTGHITHIGVDDVLEEEGLGDNSMRLTIEMTNGTVSFVSSVENITEVYETARKDLLYEN